MPSEVIQLCCRLVAEPSVNPQDKGFTEQPYGEGAMAALVVDWLQRAGLKAEVQQVRPGRENVLTTATGKDSSQTLLLCAHMDTVDVKDMSIEPFDPHIRQGRIYGRGAGDDKGPLAALMIAFRERVEQGNLPCNLALLASCGEEYDLAGARYCAGQMRGKLAAVVVGEPTELKVVVAHKGVVRLRLVSKGKSAHSSTPGRGRNAIYAMARALAVVEEYARDLTDRPGHPEHPRLKRETLAATIVNGGQQINTIPDRCEAQIDWRILPGRTPQQCRDELKAVLRRRLDNSMELELINAYESMETQADHPVVKALLAAAKKVCNRAVTGVAPYATDASAFTSLGIPTPIFGPGRPDQAHTQDEYIEIEQLEMGLAAYQMFLNSDWGLV